MAMSRTALLDLLLIAAGISGLLGLLSAYTEATYLHVDFSIEPDGDGWRIAVPEQTFALPTNSGTRWRDLELEGCPLIFWVTRAGCSLTFKGCTRDACQVIINPYTFTLSPADLQALGSLIAPRRLAGTATLAALEQDGLIWHGTSYGEMLYGVTNRGLRTWRQIKALR